MAGTTERFERYHGEYVHPAGGDAPPDGRLLITGDCDHHEFRDALRPLRFALTERRVATVCSWLREGRYDPRLIVVAISRPESVSAGDIHQLLSLAPLASAIGLLGSWCEGETRTGRPAAGLHRVYWHRWRAVDLSASDSGFGLEPPLTAPLRTATLLDHCYEQATAVYEDHRRLVAIAGDSSPASEALADACRALGYSTARIGGCDGGGVAGAAVLLWSGDLHDRRQRASLREQFNRHADARRVMLLHFPRRRDVRLARELGADAVLSQPMQLAELAGALRSQAAPAVPAVDGP